MISWRWQRGHRASKGRFASRGGDAVPRPEESGHDATRSPIHGAQTVPDTLDRWQDHLRHREQPSHDPSLAEALHRDTAFLGDTPPLLGRATLRVEEVPQARNLRLQTVAGVGTAVRCHDFDDSAPEWVASS